MANHTFTADGALPQRWTTQNPRTVFWIGAAGSEDLGGGVLKVVRVSDEGKMTTIRTITSLGDDGNRAVEAHMPYGSILDIVLSGSTTPDLYVEMESHDVERLAI